MDLIEGLILALEKEHKLIATLSDSENAMPRIEAEWRARAIINRLIQLEPRQGQA